MNQDLLNFEANFSVLDRYGTYITNEEYLTDPAIGRDQQIKELILVLLTPEKSAILIGKPGIGKTAIVEGLAYRIQKNDIPEALKGYEIINIKTASLLGSMPSGESKVQKMIDELKTKDKLILFIDEIHMLIGATDSSSLDFANIFKEGLGRGSIKVIGATTTEEYERYILRDKAFTRRFQKIEVPEPSREETIKIMMGTLPKFEIQTGKKMKYTPFIQERIMSFLVDITSEYKRVYALGSRYPDVCLTLLKQAFSYTVYDDRPYMDIFDIRKAIENSKNIYPDVIKKELPKFDSEFNDIILEEKGEKPVEEWRKDNSLTRVEYDTVNLQGENNDYSTEGKHVDNDLSKLENAPEMIDRKTLKDNKPFQSIIKPNGKNKYAKIGTISVSTGIKDKINRREHVKEIDDILLSGDVEVVKSKNGGNVKMPTSYVVTDELKKNVSDSFLLGRPISSTLDELNKDDEETNLRVYRSENLKKSKKNEGRNMWDNGNYRPERQDIRNQNFDKYNNYFHQDGNYQNNGYNQPMNNNGPYGNQMDMNEVMENQRRIDMLMGKQPSNNMPMNPGMPPQNNRMGMNPGIPPQNGMMGMNPGMPPQNGGMGMNPGMPPQNNKILPPPIEEKKEPENEKSDPLESLFGAPMYGNNEDEDKFEDIPEIYSPVNLLNDNQNNNNNGPMNGGFMGNGSMGPMGPMGGSMNPMNGPISPMNNEFNFQSPSMVQQNLMNNDSNQNNNDYSSETLFGAPMYSNDNVDNSNNDTNNNSVDIFGQLITDNMRIKNGKIVDEFPTFDKINNLSNMKTAMNDVREMPQNDKEGLIPNLETGSILKQELMPQNNGMGMNQGMMPQGGGMFGINQGMSPQNGMMGGMNQGMMPQGGGMFGINQGMPPQNGMMGMNQGMMPQNGMMGMNQGMMPQNGMMGMNQGMMPQNGMMGMNQGMMPQNGMMGMNQGMMPQNRQWTYIDGNQYQNQMQMQQNPSAFSNNILDAIPKAKEENNISVTPNTSEPTNNNDYNKDMRSGDFVNMTDLKNGQVKEEDSNKYMGVQTEEIPQEELKNEEPSLVPPPQEEKIEEPKPQVDLNLENNSNNEEEFDDFFE